ncbi:T9SS type A sorting domain-containing protein [Marivirga sp. S37H4]|uniref:T9SS type A sorting domain-containing protein n=1 Tax=Marivirga aurantiaca TaxID=2802615 RepID=A0A934WXD7_9BACT|nr:M43 family zinc metalloprotease [Marivirga aurantiaca]MBK6264878.1 T9SS type A sorting domain-containing protein [Marivirga aurantiaca]
MYKCTLECLLKWIVSSVIICLYLSSPLLGQRCPVPELVEERDKKNPTLNSHQFEKWIQEKIQLRKLEEPTQMRASARSQIVQIPVVFHIVHKGEPVGVGTNLSQERIDRQLAILNEDFKRLNSDTTETLSQFKNLAADIEIEFIYAQQNPDGFETNGVVRVLGSQSTYSYQNREILSAQSYWPAEDYLNIWVGDLSGTSLGWAEFPVSNLPGLTEASNNRLIDGVSLDYVYFGENPSSPSFESKGRTATHEMGHFFGLRHIWGDGGCSVDDFCADTPESNSSSTGCNLSKTTCGSLDMVQNFMDYTNDECMNLFTMDQKARIRTVLDNSPRRASLTTSSGLEPPEIFDNDLALFPANELFNSACSNFFSPKVIVKNVGLLSANNYEIQLIVDENVEESIVSTKELAPGESVEITFAPLSFDEYGDYEITYEVETETGQIDERLHNNAINEYVQTLEQRTVPYQRTFNNGFADWQIRNEDGEETWMQLNGYAGIPFYDNKHNIGEREQLISPIFDFTQIDVPELSFVFSQSADTLPHRFNIYASYDCGETFNDLIFSSTNQPLLTSYSVDSAFVPMHRLDWDTINIDLSRLKNEPSVSFNILVENRNANNLYISSFSIQESSKPDKRISPVRWVNTNPLFCEESIQADLEIENTGRSLVNSFDLQILNENTVVYTTTVNEMLTVGERKTISLPNLHPNDDEGEFRIITSVTSDEQLIEQSLYLPYKQDCEEELPPLRLSLEDKAKDNWYTFNPNDNGGWGYNASLDVVSSESAEVNIKKQEDWLISPLLDVSKVQYLGLIFDIAYQKPYRQSESFKILVSDERGEVFNSLIYDREGDSLATSFGNSESEELVWRNEFLDLSPFVYREKIRLAFKATHDNGQNIYLKNISFFIGRNAPPAFPLTKESFVVYPNPATDKINLHLNLDNATEGFFQITDLQGKVIVEFEEPKLLNQFITFDISRLAHGMYLLHLRTDTMRKSARFIVAR